MIKKIYHLICEWFFVRKKIAEKKHCFRSEVCLFCGISIYKEDERFKECPQIRWNKAIVQDKALMYYKSLLFDILPVSVLTRLVPVKAWFKVPIYTRIQRMFKRKLR
jgi:hypothetical protein